MEDDEALLYVTAARMFIGEDGTNIDDPVVRARDRLLPDTHEARAHRRLRAIRDLIQAADRHRRKTGTDML